MPISIIDNFTVNTTKNIDSRLGPYASVAQATGSISTLLRYVGMTVTITGSGQPVEYWFSPTTANTDLVVKTTGTDVFLRNETNASATDTITVNQSVFNPSNLTVLSSSIFIIEAEADYYVLGDVMNSGSIIVDGTLKIGGALYNSGSITGTGIIE